MNSRFFLAIYDEQKLFSQFFHNSLERLHRYDVLFRAETEEELLKYLGSAVGLLLMHIPIATERSILLLEKILKKHSKLEIYEAENGILIDENKVYMLPVVCI